MHMNEYLTILTTGGLLALFALLVAYFLFAPDGGQHKRSLYRMAALLFAMLLIWNLLFVVEMLWRPQWAMNWQLGLAFNLPLFPFITFVVKEMLYPDKHVGWRTILRHAGPPFALLAVYILTYYLAPSASVWVLGLMIVWGIAYLGVMLPLAFIRVRRYDALVREIFVDTEGRSLVWLARLSAMLFVFYLMYAIFSTFELSYLTTWLFNVIEFFVYMVLGLQIARMRSSDLVHIDQPEDEPEPEVAQMADEQAAAVADPAAKRLVAELEQWLLTDQRLSSHDLNREMVARAMCTNHVTLARILRQQTGMTLAQFVTDVRMREAERLLTETLLTIEEIYLRVGYQTRSTFSRAFQDRNNCSATEWRAQHSKPNKPNNK